MSKKLTSYKSSALFIVFILLILFILWNAPPIEGPPIPNDDEHSTIEEETSCMECHIFEELLKGNNYHPPKTECLECHRATVTTASYP
jgi:hypothetical protein